MTVGIKVTDKDELAGVDWLYGVFDGSSGKVPTSQLTSLMAGAVSAAVEGFGLGEDAAPLVGDLDTWYRAGLAYGLGGTHGSASTGDNPFSALTSLFFLLTSSSALGDSTQYVHQTAFYTAGGVYYVKHRQKNAGAWSSWISAGERHFLTLSAFQSWSANATVSAGEKATVYSANAGLLTFVYSGSAWLPVARTPDHYAVNTTPGTTDMAAALTSAMAAGPTTLKGGVYRLSSDVTISSQLTIEPGASIRVNSGVTLTISAPIIASDDHQIFTNNGTITGTADAGVEAVYARWFGVPQSNNSTDVATELQDAIDLAQGLDCWLVLPHNGQIRQNSQTTFKHGQNNSGDTRPFNVYVDMNGCEVVHGFDGVLWAIVPRCLIADKGTGRGDAEIVIKNGSANGTHVSSNSWTSAKFIQVGTTTTFCSGFKMNRIEDVICRYYVQPPLYQVNARHLTWLRVFTRNYSGGLTMLAQGADAFCGDTHLEMCEFTGNSTARPLSIYASSASGTAQARAIFAEGTVIYGDGSLIDAGSGGRVHEVWLNSIQWDSALTGHAVPALKIQTSSGGSVWQVHVNSPYVVNFEGLAFQAVGNALGDIVDVKVDGGRFTLNKSTAALMQFSNVTAGSLTNNHCWDNDCAAVFDLNDGCVGFDISGNQVPDESATYGDPTYLVDVTGANTNGILVNRNIVKVGTGVVNDSMTGTDKDFTGNLEL